jgi:hypothetical protein
VRSTRNRPPGHGYCLALLRYGNAHKNVLERTATRPRRSMARGGSKFRAVGGLTLAGAVASHRTARRGISAMCGSSRANCVVGASELRTGSGRGPCWIGCARRSSRR